MAYVNGDSHSNRKVSVIIGAQWGDEGKGKIVDMLAKNVDILCRCQGGSNAGHTVVVDENRFVFHLIPCGILHANCRCIIGNGVVIHLPSLFDELEANGILSKSGEWDSRYPPLIISDRAHLVFDMQQQVDGLQESELNKSNQQIGTTKKGIGPTYSSKCLRNGIRVCDLLGDFENFETRFRGLVDYYKMVFSTLQVDVDSELKRYKAISDKLKQLDLARDTVSYLNKKINDPSIRSILVEGANGALLDIDFGTYPYVTSSNCTIGGVMTGLGIPPSHIGGIIGIVKAYTTRVGAGVFPTELHDDIGEHLCLRGHEYGSTTGRRRRCGWLDMVFLKYGHMINGYTAMALTKLDILDGLEVIKIGIGYVLDGAELEYVPALHGALSRVQVKYLEMPGWSEDTSKARKFSELPLNAQRYVEKIEELLGVPIKWIGVGQDRSSLIIRHSQAEKI